MKLSERLAQLSKESDSKAERKTEPAENVAPEPGSAPGARIDGREDSSEATPQMDAAIPGKDLDYSRGKKKEGIEHLKAAIRSAVVKELGPKLASGTVDEDELRMLLERHLSEALRTSNVGVSPSDKGHFFDDLIADMVGWGPLETLMEDESVTEIMCNAHDDVWVERDGLLQQTDVEFSSLASYRQVIDRMLAIAGRRVDEAAPMADGRLKDGSRINAIIPPLVVGEPILTVRRFPEKAFTADDLVTIGSLSKEAAGFLQACVEGKLNILISGGTGTGKTTLLNVLSNFIPSNERVLTIEDAAELRLGQPHVVTLEARPANIEGAGAVSIRDLVRNALRMRPDRIVVGEVRGAEALDMLQAMNTGHEGSLTTVHANSPRDALSRIETMVLFSGLDLPLRAVREQVASALDIIVQLERRNDGKRVVSLIAEIQGREGETVTMQDVYKREGAGDLTPTGLRPKVTEKLGVRGVKLAPALFRSSGEATEGTTARRRRKTTA